jgi:hypothetical protein
MLLAKNLSSNKSIKFVINFVLIFLNLNGVKVVIWSTIEKEIEEFEIIIKINIKENLGSNMVFLILSRAKVEAMEINRLLLNEVE